MAVILAIGPAALAAPASVSVDRTGVSALGGSFTGWEMNLGEGLIKDVGPFPIHGHVSEYGYATFPSEDDPDWGPAPDEEYINFQEIPSSLCGVCPCLEGLQFTYFRTSVYIPSGATKFHLESGTVDDGLQLSLNNVVREYAYLGGYVSTDLLPYANLGAYNDLTIIQVDDCCYHSYLYDVRIYIDGEEIPEEPEQQAPVADAGPDQTINEGDAVTLNGSNSHDVTPPTFDVDGRGNAIDVRGQGKPYDLSYGVYTVSVLGSWTDGDTGRMLTSVWALHGLNDNDDFAWVEELRVGETYTWDVSSFEYTLDFFLLDDSSSGNTGTMTVNFDKNGTPQPSLSLDAAVNTVGIASVGISRSVSGDILRLGVTGAWDNGPGLVNPKEYVYAFTGSPDESVPWIQILFVGTLYEFPVVDTGNLIYFFIDQWTGDNSGLITVEESTLAFSWDLNNYADGNSDGNFTNDVDATGPIVTHVYGDNGVFDVWLTVTNSVGLSGYDKTIVTVENVAPSVQCCFASAWFDISLRIAGEKWHDVAINLYEDGSEIWSARIVREPGNPDEQRATIQGVVLDLMKEYSATVVYTPMDDPVNGQPNGANPVWIILTAEDGNETWIHHTFNVRHPETWEWEVSINQHLVGQSITFEASATDPGSDDLTFEWEWGDGSPVEGGTYFNDGALPDPYPSPEGTFPFSATDVRTHTYATPASYDVLLRVTDDDGGLTELIVTIVVI
ncbi:MAG: PKD domain-containing protein [Methanobacteriota archaeon]|nr:MAG: PKD domain-containing protein [Euryarchaeota archaeon]